MADPFVNPIDTNDPEDIESAALGAERIRQLKRGLIERLATAYRGFPEEDPEHPGEALLFPIASVLVGSMAQLPAAPDREGTVFIAEDEDRYFYGTTEGTWRELQLAGATGGPLTVLGQHHDMYIDGAESSSAGYFRRLLALRVRGTTDANGLIQADLSTLNQDWLVSNMVGLFCVIKVNMNAEVGTVGGSAVNDAHPHFVNLISASGGALPSDPQILTFRVHGLKTNTQDDADLLMRWVDTEFVSFDALIPFSNPLIIEVPDEYYY